MSDVEFEGTLVLEHLAAIGRLEEFADAIDSDDTRRAAELMRIANVDASTIAIVLKQMGAGDGEP